MTPTKEEKRAKRLEYEREYRAKNPDYHRNYRKNNPDKMSHCGERIILQRMRH